MNEHDLSRAMWRKSSYRNGQANCVEAACNLPGIVAIRDSKDPDGEALTVSFKVWRVFIQAIADGDSLR
jgi:hypothetical protein